jgi:hypothetical protein
MIGRTEHAYSISVKQEQRSKLQSCLPSIDRSFDAVLISTKHQGHMYMIVYMLQTPEKWVIFKIHFRTYSVLSHLVLQVAV